MSIHNEDVKEQKRQKTMELQKEQKKELAQKFSKVFKTLIKEDLEEKIKFAVEIKGKIIPVLQHRIRFLVFSSKK